jgi:hypothetical protein
MFLRCYLLNLKDIFIIDNEEEAYFALNHSFTRVFLSHCDGDDITLSLITHTPQLCIPLIPPQVENGQRLEDMNLGVSFPLSSLSSEEIASGILYVASNRNLRNHSHLYSHFFQNHFFNETILQMGNSLRSSSTPTSFLLYYWVDALCSFFGLFIVLFLLLSSLVKSNK